MDGVFNVVAHLNYICQRSKHAQILATRKFQLAKTLFSLKKTTTKTIEDKNQAVMPAEQISATFAILQELILQMY